MKKVCILLALIPLLLSSSTASAQDGEWRLVWGDEFKQPEGSPPDASKWSYDTGGNGWGNHELEHYTSRTNNVRIENGKLVIEARKENFAKRNYTSGRIQTAGKFSATYGRFEARIKIPRGQGIWPAFWPLGTNIAETGWPACGEIDIMENIGKEPETIHGTVHGPGYSGGKGIGGPTTLPGGASVADEFHVFAVECEPDRVAWFMDGKQYFEVTPARLPKGTRWAFNGPKFVILNLAVGGDWPGNPDSTSTYPQRMVVEYVRVYEKAPGLQSRK
jgi:beta-glucanase (GH16 family)